jgi:hypothetical protein
MDRAKNRWIIVLLTGEYAVVVAEQHCLWRRRECQIDVPFFSVPVEAPAPEA